MWQSDSAEGIVSRIIKTMINSSLIIVIDIYWTCVKYLLLVIIHVEDKSNLKVYNEWVDNQYSLISLH
jgi:hypothetical protein